MSDHLVVIPAFDEAPTLGAIVAEARRHGSVLVVDAYDFLEAGPFGEIMAVAAQVRGIAGLVTSGSVRDRDAILFADGGRAWSGRLAAPVTSGLGLGLGLGLAAAGGARFPQAVFYTDPELEVDYRDGADRRVQQQVADDDAFLATATLYDPAGRAAISSLLARLAPPAGGLAAFAPDLAAFDWRTYTFRGLVADQHPEAGGYRRLENPLSGDDVVVHIDGERGSPAPADTWLGSEVEDSVSVVDERFEPRVGEGLVADAEPALGSPLAKLAEVGGSPVDATERDGRNAGADGSARGQARLAARGAPRPGYLPRPGRVARARPAASRY